MSGVYSKLIIEQDKKFHNRSKKYHLMCKKWYNQQLREAKKINDIRTIRCITIDMQPTINILKKNMNH